MMSSIIENPFLISCRIFSVSFSVSIWVAVKSSCSSRVSNPSIIKSLPLLMISQSSSGGVKHLSPEHSIVFGRSEESNISLIISSSSLSINPKLITGELFIFVQVFSRSTTTRVIKITITIVVHYA